MPFIIAGMVIAAIFGHEFNHNRQRNEMEKKLMECGVEVKPEPFGFYNIEKPWERLDGSDLRLR